MADDDTGSKRDAPLEVKVVALPEGFADAVALAARVETLERQLEDALGRIAALEAGAEKQMLRGGGLKMSTPPDAGDRSAEPAEEAETVAIRDLVRQLGEEIYEGQPEDSPYAIDNVMVDVKGALGGDTRMGMSSRRPPTADTASTLRFTLRRKPNVKKVK